MSGIRKSLVFRKIQSFVKGKFIKKNDHIIDIDVRQHRNVNYWACDTKPSRPEKKYIVGFTLPTLNKVQVYFTQSCY